MTTAREIADATTPGGHAPSVRAARAFAVLALVQGTLIFTIALITVPLPRIAEELDLTAADLLLVLAAYGLPFSGLLLFGGRLADRYGGRRMVTVGLVVFGTASAAAAAVPGFAALVAVRFAQGVGGALVAPAAMAVLRSLFPGPAAHGRAMARWGSVSVLGAILGFVLSGVVTTWVSWRWMFAVPVAVSVVGLAATRSLMPAGVAEGAGRRPGLDRLGAVLATVGISAGSFGLIATGDHPWGSATVVVPLACGIGLLVAFALVERAVGDPLLPPGFLLARRRAAGLVGMFLAAAGSGVVNFALSLHLQQELGWTPLATAGAFVPFALALVATGQAAAPLVGRAGPLRVTSAGLLVAAGGLGLLARLSHDTPYATGLLPGLVLVAVGIALAFSGSAVLATADVPPERAGLAGGVMNTAMELGPTVGLAILMSVAAIPRQAVTGYAWAFGVAAVAYVLAAGLVGALAARHRAGERRLSSRRPGGTGPRWR